MAFRAEVHAPTPACHYATILRRSLIVWDARVFELKTHLVQNKLEKQIELFVTIRTVRCIWKAFTASRAHKQPRKAGAAKTNLNSNQRPPKYSVSFDFTISLKFLWLMQFQNKTIIKSNQRTGLPETFRGTANHSLSKRTNRNLKACKHFIGRKVNRVYPN